MKRLIDEREPNSGHLAIAELTKQLANKRVTPITQRRVGITSTQVVGPQFSEPHGSTYLVALPSNCSRRMNFGWMPVAHPIAAQTAVR